MILDCEYLSRPGSEILEKTMYERSAGSNERSIEPLCNRPVLSSSSVHWIRNRCSGSQWIEGVRTQECPSPPAILRHGLHKAYGEKDPCLFVGILWRRLLCHLHCRITVLALFVLCWSVADLWRSTACLLEFFVCL